MARAMIASLSKLNTLIRSWLSDFFRTAFGPLTSWHRTPRCTGHFFRPFDDGRLFAVGASGVLESLPCGHVRKIPHPQDEGEYRRRSLRDIKREYDVYQRLGNARHVLQVVEFSRDDGIVLPYVPRGCLKTFLQDTDDRSISRTQRIRWAASIAEALSTLHQHGVIHCALKPENVLLDSNLNAFLIDFSGSTIDGSWASAMESVRFYLPRHIDDECNQVTDLFALGSTVYQIMTGEPPYHDRSDEEVEDLFQQGEFPPVDHLPCGEVIRRCWRQEIPTAQHAYHEILRSLSRVQACRHRVGGRVHYFRQRLGLV